MFVIDKLSTNNLQITKALVIQILHKPKTSMFIRLSMLVGISEAIRLLSTHSSNSTSTKLLIEKKQIDNKFNEWLSGLIDGDGCFQLSKKGYASLEIVMDTRDKHCLYIVKQKFGGSIKLKSGFKWLRYRLHHKEGLLNIIKSVNGLIRNPDRILQLGKLCEKYDVILKYPQPLTYDNGWLSGFIDSDGSVYMNQMSDQIFITASQKNKYILDPLVKLYGGTIYPMVKVGAFKWTVFRKDDILNLLNYFEDYPLRSDKHKRIKLIFKYNELRKLKAHKASDISPLGKAWNRFLKKWENYE
jgi:hypothetical protein